jgi:beta-phosphoglucomutase-like phosphatase (HAD superfamily)
MERAIIFDVDGTLAETEEAHREAFNRAFVEAGLPWSWDRDLYRQLLAVTGGKERIRCFIDDFGAKGAPGDDLDEFIGALHAKKTHAYTRFVSAGHLELRPGVRKLFAQAREQRYRLAIATPTTPANIDALLAATLGEDGHHLFDVICAGDSVPNKKPAPDVYLLALEHLGLPGDRCIAIEDSRNGLLSARAAGIETIVTPSVYTQGESFDEAALVVDDLQCLVFADMESLFEQRPN